IEAGTAAILNASMPLFTLVLARFWRHEEALTVNKLCGILFGIAGVAVAIGVGGAIFAGSFAGKMAMLGACLSYGIGTNYARGFLHIPLINTAAAQSSFAALMALPLMFIFEHPFAVELALTPVLAMIGYGLFSTALAYLVYFRLLNRAGATNTSLVTLLIPVTTIVLSGWLLQEKLEAHLFAGMVLIGFGLILVDGRVFGLLGRHRQS
ncbi:MAG: DMT family transporter, partial [Pseudomonadota bacterium]